jgi:translation initiation factor RLI1
MSRDEIADMLKQQELFAAAGAKTQKQFKENIILMQQRGTLQSDFLSKLSEEQAQLFLNSTATETIAAFLDKIRQSFANLLNSPEFKSFIDAVIVKLSDPNFINNIINQISGFVSVLLKAVAAVVDGADYAVRILSLGFGDISNEIPNQIRRYANEIGSVSLSAYLVDHYRKAEVRYDMAAKGDQHTGQMNKD